MSAGKFKNITSLASLGSPQRHCTSIHHLCSVVSPTCSFVVLSVSCCWCPLLTIHVVFAIYLNYLSRALNTCVHHEINFQGGKVFLVYFITQVLLLGGNSNVITVKDNDSIIFAHYLVSDDARLRKCHPFVSRGGSIHVT